jgi:sec-independent protein translocase protein TatA
MGIENPVHLLFIAAVALIVLGPRRLPELTRALGRGIREFREAIAGQEEPVDAEVVEGSSPVGEEQPGAEPASAHQPHAVPGQPVQPEPVPADPGVASAPLDAAGVDPAQPVRSGDAPDRRPL